MNSIIASSTAYSHMISSLGVDFTTPDQVAKARPSIVYTDERIDELAKSLPAINILVWSKANNYAIIAAPPTQMSTFDIRKMDSFRFTANTGPWCQTVR